MLINSTHLFFHWSIPLNIHGLRYCNFYATYQLKVLKIIFTSRTFSMTTLFGPLECSGSHQCSVLLVIKTRAEKNCCPEAILLILMSYKVYAKYHVLSDQHDPGFTE
jgi:hypothetical protein